MVVGDCGILYKVLLIVENCGLPRPQLAIYSVNQSSPFLTIVYPTIGIKGYNVA